MTTSTPDDQLEPATHLAREAEAKLTASFDDSYPRSRPRFILRRPALGALALAGVLLLASLLIGQWSLSEPEGRVFVIRAGTKASIARPGFDSAIAIPTDIRFGPNEPAVITVRNLDDITHRAGPFLVGPGQTYVQRFPEPGQYPIACAVDPLESIVVTVQG